MTLTPSLPFQTGKAAFSKQERWFSRDPWLHALFCISSLVPNDSAVQCGVSDNWTPLSVAPRWGLQSLTREDLQQDPLHQPEGHGLHAGPSLSTSVNSHSWALRANQHSGAFLLAATHNTPSPPRLSLGTVRSPPPWQGWGGQSAAAVYQISYLLTQT